MPKFWATMLSLGLNNAPTTRRYRDNRFVSSLRQKSIYLSIYPSICLYILIYIKLRYARSCISLSVGQPVHPSTKGVKRQERAGKGKKVQEEEDGEVMMHDGKRWRGEEVGKERRVLVEWGIASCTNNISWGFSEGRAHCTRTCALQF